MPKRSNALHPAAERRPAVWPWLLMPIAALAVYAALWSVRHSAVRGSTAGPAAAVSEDAADQ